MARNLLRYFSKWNSVKWYERISSSTYCRTGYNGGEYLPRAEPLLGFKIAIAADREVPGTTRLS